MPGLEDEEGWTAIDYLGDYRYKMQGDTRTGNLPASKVKLRYWVASRRKPVEGTLLTLLFDRLRNYREFARHLPKD